MAVTINGTTGIAVPLGSVSAPGVSNTTSSTTGIYNPTSTTLGIATSGTNALYIDASQNVGIGTTSPATKLDIGSGNLNFSSTSQRITGDFTNATVASRSMFQTNTTNGSTGIYALPNGTSTAASWQATNAADPTNASKILIATNGSTDVQLVSGINGTGTYLPLTFYTNGAEKMRLDTSGNVTISKSTTAVGTVGTAILYTGRVQVSNAASTSADDGFQLYSTGASAYRFYVGMGGVINATSTSITAISDQSLKTNIRPLDTGLVEIMQLKPRRFDWKEETLIGETNVAGFIAQEVQEVLPELIYNYKYNETETKLGLKMGDMLPTVVKAIQEAVAKINDLSAEIQALKAKVGA